MMDDLPRLRQLMILASIVATINAWALFSHIPSVLISLPLAIVAGVFICAGPAIAMIFVLTETIETEGPAE